MNTSSSKEQLLDSENKKKLPAAIDSVINSLYSSLESWSSVVQSGYTRNLDKLLKYKEKLSEQINIPEWVDWGLPEDWISVQGMFYMTLFTIITVCTFVISLNIYRKIRYSIPARVNCWFCNNNTKVPYPLRETWTCPTCRQYNGFTADGNYNKRIPAQFIEALNCPVRGCAAEGYQPKPMGSNSNGLCSQCNLNQVLKVFQLSSFVAVNDKNYDAEIEAEQKRLEQLYDICPQCKLVVEETLKRTPEKQHLVTQRKVQVNKVSSSPPTPPTTVNNEVWKRIVGENSSKSSDNHSTNSLISLHNLKIGSTRRNDWHENFHTPVNRASTMRSPSPQRLSSPPPGFSSPVYASNPNLYGSPTTFAKEMQPLWKDYPMVRNGVSPTFSMIDTMSCPPVGRPAYVTFNSLNSPSPPPSPPQQFSYQTSNVGSVFGGRKPLLSPPSFYCTRRFCYDV
ncbi:Transmembrane protein [Orchesella cincta]|uniref:Transmembrane protein n=1 Tax=Orchesella cincta TaxID=48709 RepID=A0A1D2MMQ3_ORCCI|nr:Transmembrane protein [Orchesella cincta]